MAVARAEYLDAWDFAERRDDAFRWLEAALELHDPGLVYLATAPGFASLRADPRFAAMLRRIGLTLPSDRGHARGETSERSGRESGARREGGARR